MKTCSKCGVEKSVDEFGKKYINKSGKQVYQPYCKECQKIYLRQHYNKNKSYYIDKNTEHRHRNRDWIKDYKSNLSCEICGEDEPVCLDFHHKDPDEKEYSISKIQSTQISISTIKKEISKCIVLCANCHRKVHAGIITPPTTTILI